MPGSYLPMPLHVKSLGHQQACYWPRSLTIPMLSLNGISNTLCCINIHTQYTPFAKSNGRFFPDTKNNMMPSSNFYDFWWMHKMHTSGYFLRKIYWLFALTRSVPGGLNTVSVIFSKSSLNSIVYILVQFDRFKWNFPSLKLDTLS